MGHKFNEKFYNFEEIVIYDYKEITMAGPMGQTVLSGGFSFFGFSLKSEKIGKVWGGQVKFKVCTPSINLRLCHSCDFQFGSMGFLIRRIITLFLHWMTNTLTAVALQMELGWIEITKDREREFTEHPEPLQTHTANLASPELKHFWFGAILRLWEHTICWETHRQRENDGHKLFGFVKKGPKAHCLLQLHSHRETAQLQSHGRNTTKAITHPQ